MKALLLLLLQPPSHLLFPTSGEEMPKPKPASLRKWWRPSRKKGKKKEKLFFLINFVSFLYYFFLFFSSRTKMLSLLEWKKFQVPRETFMRIMQCQMCINQPGWLGIWVYKQTLVYGLRSWMDQWMRFVTFFIRYCRAFFFLLSKLLTTWFNFSGGFLVMVMILAVLPTDFTIQLSMQITLVKVNGILGESYTLLGLTPTIFFNLWSLILIGSENFKPRSWPRGFVTLFACLLILSHETILSWHLTLLKKIMWWTKSRRRGKSQLQMN